LGAVNLQFLHGNYMSLLCFSSLAVLHQLMSAQAGFPVTRHSRES
jgi:hypothetical protein